MNDIAKLKISSLNIVHLSSRMDDLKADREMMKSDIICLQETSFNTEDGALEMDGFTFYSAGKGRSQGVAIFVRNILENNLEDVIPIEEDYAQFLKLKFSSIDIITVYRSPNQRYRSCIPTFIDRMKNLIDIDKRTIIVGDLNYEALRHDNLDNRLKSIKLSFESLGFRQCVKFPTHIGGGCLDHVYCNKKEREFIKIYYSYYTDHEAVCMVVDKLLMA